VVRAGHGLVHFTLEIGAAMALTHRPRTLLTAYRLIRSFMTPEVRDVLRPSGLSDEEVERGKTLLADARRARVGQRVRNTPVVREVLDWGRQEFPVIHAVLGDVAPEIEAEVFDGVVPTNTSSDLFLVEIVCSRLLDLASSENEADVAAAQALEAHGVKQAEVSATLEKCADQAHFETASAETVKARDAAIDALHRFHKKWSRIARARIKDRRVLRMMGIGRNQPGAKEAPVEDAADATPNGAATTGALPATPPKPTEVR
jgi:hypothetical protein